MIQLRIQNYSYEELETLEKSLSHAIISLPCDSKKTGICKGTECKIFKICNDLAHAHEFVCKALNLPF